MLDYTLLYHELIFEFYISRVERKLAAATRTTTELLWAGHVQGIEEELMPIRLFYATIIAKREVGRQRPRWLDAVIGDTKKLLVMMCWRRILD